MDSSTPKSRVEQVLDERDRTIAWLARKVGVHPTYAWKMIRGLRPLTETFKRDAAVALELDVDDLFPAGEPAGAS